MTLSNYYFQIHALAYIVLISIVFFFRQKKKTAENATFSQLIIVGFIAEFFDIAHIYFLYNQPSSIYYEYSYKLYLIFIVYFVLVFTEYAVSLAQSNLDPEDKLAKQNKLSNGIMTFMIFWGILIVYLDQFFSSNDGLYIHSLITYLTIGLTVLCLISWVIMLLLNKEKITSKKLVPITLIIVLGIFSAIIQYLTYVSIIVPTFIFAIITLYFTIFPLENPNLGKLKELEEAKQEALKSNKSKTDYLSNVSHEIRTPLNAILGFSQSLLEQNITKEVREEVEDIINASEALLEIVNDILDISKIESKKLEIINVDYSSEKLYKSLVSMTEEKIGSRSLQFIHSFSSNIPEVLYGDFVRVKQIVMNLLTNAVKYTDAGFIKLSINSEIIDKSTIQLIISVTDSGIGIKEENIDKLFSNYSGLELREDIDIEGTGLGLSLTKILVKMMGGKIVVQSKYEEGSTFTVYLNQQISTKTLKEIEAETPKMNTNAFVGTGQKILIVDDNEVNLKVAKRLMSNYNLNIETSNNGKDCIRKIVEGNSYDLILLDDMMQGLSGVETLNILKENVNFNTPTIALTANAQSGMKEKYLRDGFTDYLAKPINKQLLENLLISYLNQDDNTKIFEDNKNDSEKDITDSKEQLRKEYLLKNNIDVESSIDLLGDLEMYNETAKDFISEIDNKMIQIEQFKNSNDMNNYAILVHSLKSDSKYLGLTKLSQLSYDHEMASKQNDIGFVNTHYDELMKEAKKMIQVLKEYLEKE